MCFSLVASEECTGDRGVQKQPGIHRELDKHAIMQVNGTMSNSGVRQAYIYAGKSSHVQRGS